MPERLGNRAPCSWGSPAAGEPHPRPSSLLILWQRETPKGDFRFKRSLAINSLEKSENRGERVVLEEVQRKKALGRQAPALPEDHCGHFPPPARAMEKELRSKLEIRWRPSFLLKLNYSKLISVMLCVLYKRWRKSFHREPCYPGGAGSARQLVPASCTV